MGTSLEDFTIDQAAGALALSLGAIGSLLLVIWQSRCACRCRIGLSDNCYIFDCSREPPPTDDDKKKKAKKSLNKDKNDKNKEEEDSDRDVAVEEEEEEPLKYIPGPLPKDNP